METNCQHCNHTFTDNFCSKCGQKQYKRIDKKYISDELQYTLIHTNKGFLYSAKNILKNPGKTAREYISGNRVSHYKPISLAFVLSGISAFISFKILDLASIMKKQAAMQSANTAMQVDFIDKFTAFYQSNSAIIMLMFVPILALFSMLSFRKWGENYYEHTVMNAYGLCFYNIFTIIFVYPIYYIFRNNVEVFTQISMIGLIAIPLMMFWFYKNFYPDASVKSLIFRVLAKTSMLVVLYFGIIIIAVIGFFISKGPDAKKYLPQPKVQTEKSK